MIKIPLGVECKFYGCDMHTYDILLRLHIGWELWNGGSIRGFAWLLTIMDPLTAFKAQYVNEGSSTTRLPWCVGWVGRYLYPHMV